MINSPPVSQPGGLARRRSTINNRWRYFAAKRSREQKLREFATMYGANYAAIEQRILAHMSMSRDRVHFKLDLINGATSEVRAAFARAFGMQFPSPRYGEPVVTIICRPSQFARFLIYRNELGGKNLFSTLEPKLVEVNPQDTIDVSTNPRRD